MSLVCHICLRHTKNLRTLGQQSALIDLYEDLCSNEYESLYYKFCSECIAKLKKCQDFKIQCNLAKKIFDSWKSKKSNRGSVFELCRDMPTTNLSYCNRKNFRVYFYHTPDVTSSATIHTFNSHPHIVTVNIPQGDINTDKDITPLRIVTDHDDDNIIEPLKTVNDDEIKVELSAENIIGLNDDEGLSGDELKTELTKIEDFDDGKIKIEIFGKNNDDKSSSHNKRKSSSDEEGLSDDAGPIDDLITGLSDEGLTSDDEAVESDSDKSLQELISRIKKLPKNPKVTQTTKVEQNTKTKKRTKNIKKQRKKRKINLYDNRFKTLDTFKKELKQKIMEAGVVKDEDGIVVDFDGILDNADKLPIRDLRTCMQIINEEVFNYENVQRLCKVQSKYIEYASVFDIQYLNNIDEVKAEFSRRHEYPDYVKSKFRCEDCFSGFEYQKLLDYHRRIAHNPAKQFSCDLCKMRFVDRKYVLKHRIDLHSTVYKCKKCPYIVTYKVGMEHHYRKHTGIKYKCEYCPAEFNRNNHRYAHMNKKHLGKQRILHCQFCAYSTHSSKGLINHHNHMHSDEKFVEDEWNKKCEECNVTFITEDVYKKHVRIMHTSAFKNQNNIQKKKSKPLLKTPRILTCRLCTDTGSNPGWLVRHFRDVHPNESMELVYRHRKQFLCDECGKGFQNKQLLEGHINQHKNMRPFKCPNAKCSRAFHTRQKLVIHMERHEPPKYECKECGKKFRSNPNLYNHSMTHKQDKCHVCEYCGKGFITKAMLNEHVRGVHMNIKRKRNRGAKPEMDCE